MTLEELEKHCQEKKPESTSTEICPCDAYKGKRGRHDSHLGGVEQDRPYFGPLFHWVDGHGRDITRDPYDMYNSLDDYYKMM